MRRRGLRRPRALAISAVLAVAAACTSSPGQSASSTVAPATGAGPTAAASPSVTGGDVVTASRSVRIQSPPGGSFLVRGAYPHVTSECVHHSQPRLAARYPGTLLVRRADDGSMSITVTVPFERYLDGLAEVPSTWPPAALEAQAIAARSYALSTTGWSGRQGETLDTPICATTSCQVYGGIPLGRLHERPRWVAAVRRTARMVLLYQGRPADTVYFSTSNGHTYGNEDVFGSDPLPYLRPVAEHDDGASPLSHWRAEIPFRDLGTFLSRDGLWPAGRRITLVSGDGSIVTVSGPGQSRRLDGTAFRDAVNRWAPCLRPARYPQGGLPLSVPSRWMQATSRGGVAVITGRGWGHGVGMVQWGAYGKARRGLSAAQILAFYYGGLRPTRFPEPGLIHVRVASGITSLRLVPSATGARLAGQPLAPRRLTVTGGDELVAKGPALRP